VVYLSAKGAPYAHWAAGINLMASAYETGDVTMGDQYARALKRARMPARLVMKMPTAPADLPRQVKELLAVVRERHSLPIVLGRWHVGEGIYFGRPPLRTKLRRGRPPRSDIP
jgi:hypothetical protein